MNPQGGGGTYRDTVVLPLVSAPIHHVPRVPSDISAESFLENCLDIYLSYLIASLGSG